MNDLDALARRCAHAVHQSVADLGPPPSGLLPQPLPSRRPKGVTVGVAAAAVVVVALLPVAWLNSGFGPAEKGDSSALGSVVTSIPSDGGSALLDSPTVGSGEVSPEAAPFDVGAFLATNLGGALDRGFDDITPEVSVVLLVPEDAAEAVETVISKLAEVEGYSMVDQESLASALAMFAAGHNLEPLAGGWLGYGLIPQFSDSPIDKWVQELSWVKGVHVARVDWEPPTLNLPDGWEMVADLPFGLPNRALVETVGGGVVIAAPDGTWMVATDGTVRRGDPAPLFIEANGLPAGDHFVIVRELSTETWILDTDTMNWRQADPRPSTGYPSASAVIEDELFVVSTGPTAGDRASTVAALSLRSGTWSELPAVPEPISAWGLTTDGHRVIVAGARQDLNNRILGETNIAVFAYTAETGWEKLPDLPLNDGFASIIWVEGAGLLGWEHGLGSAFLTETGDWEPLADVPIHQVEAYPKSAVAPGGIVALGGSAAWFDAQSHQWTAIPTPAATRLVVVDQTLGGLTPTGRETTKLSIFPLPP